VEPAQEARALLAPCCPCSLCSPRRAGSSGHGNAEASSHVPSTLRSAPAPPRRGPPPGPLLAVRRGGVPSPDRSGCVESGVRPCATRKQARSYDASSQSSPAPVVCRLGAKGRRAGRRGHDRH
jgi:hypothetical protein